MKALFLSILFMSPTAWAATSELLVSPSQTEHFTYGIKEEFLPVVQIGVKVEGASEEKLIKTPNSISDATKLTVRLNVKENKFVEQELLFVVTSMNANQQQLLVYAPVRLGDVVVGEKIEAICSKVNDGDFSWETPEELSALLRLVEDGRLAHLEMKVKEPGEKKSKFIRSGCSFRLLKN